MPDSSRFEDQMIWAYIERHWIIPASPEKPSDLDSEDWARARLIHELQSVLGVNDESIPIILDLVDQLHCLRLKIKKGGAH